MKTIVALVDFSEVTSKILAMARTLATALQSRVVLLHVIPPEPVVATMGAEAPSIPPPPTREEIEAEKMKLQRLLNSLTDAGVSATALQFEGPVTETVVEETKRLNTDLVIMGSHHHNALYNLFVGSVTSDLLKRLPFPMLVVPADAEEKEALSARDRQLSAQEVRQNAAVVQPVLSA